MLGSRGLVKISAVEKNCFSSGSYSHGKSNQQFKIMRLLQPNSKAQINIHGNNSHQVIQNPEALTANSGHQKFKTMRLLQP